MKGHVSEVKGHVSEVKGHVSEVKGHVSEVKLPSAVEDPLTCFLSLGEQLLSLGSPLPSLLQLSHTHTHI